MLTSTHISLLSRRGRGTRAAAGPRHDLAVNRTPNGPGYSPFSHHSAHSPKPNTRGNSPLPAGISEFPPAASFPAAVVPPRGPGALVTSPQDLLITVRAVITTVRLRPGAARRVAARGRLSRRNFVFRKYAVTCDVSA